MGATDSKDLTSASLNVRSSTRELVRIIKSNQKIKPSRSTCGVQTRPGRGGGRGRGGRGRGVVVNKKKYENVKLFLKKS